MGLANLGRMSLWVGESQAVYIQEEESAADFFFLMDQGKVLAFPWV